MRLFIITLFITILFLYSVVAEGEPPKDRLPFECEKINILYTWVDGSDPAHAASRAKKLGLSADDVAASAARFRDLNGLMYSLRSLEKNAPWVDKIFIYTANQIPSYVDVDNPKISMIFHEDVFPNKTDLPTFSSDAIEASFPWLPEEVGPCFIYLNDDVFFGNEVQPGDFLDITNGQSLFIDGWEAPAADDIQEWDPWHKNIASNNGYLDEVFGPARRPYTAHGPHLLHLEILRKMGKLFEEKFLWTMHHPLRVSNGTAMPFLYHHYTYNKYNSIQYGTNVVWQGLFNDNPDQVCADLNSLLTLMPKSVCLNDQMGDIPNQQVLDCSTSVLDTLFPKKSAYEC